MKTYGQIEKKMLSWTSLYINLQFHSQAFIACILLCTNVSFQEKTG